MSDRSRIRSLIGALLIGVSMSAGCATASVNKVLTDPGHYRNREVTLKGVVVDSYSITDRGVYRLRDGTGQLWIVSSKGVPRTGANVRVTGTVREGFNLGILGDRLNLPPGVAAGLVLVESSHKATR
jgi:hypothetical protein